MLQKLRQRISLLNRTVRLTIAGWIVRKLGCTTVSSDMMLLIVKKLAELDSYLESSGEIQHRKLVYAQLVSRLREIGQGVEGAVRMGDPKMDLGQLIQVYQQARWISMSQNQRKKIQRAQAAQEIAKLPPNAPVMP